jgi:hypothetical protein
LVEPPIAIWMFLPCCVIRLPLETMKIDPADHILGQRLNVWVAAAALLSGLAWFVICWSRRRPNLHPAPHLATASAQAPTHVVTRRPETAIAARRASQRRKR